MIQPEFADLGIPSDYGVNPRRPAYAEATELVDAEPNVIGTMQRLAPDTAEAWKILKGAAARDGVQLLLVSGFRSLQHQADLIRRKLAAGHTIEAILKVNAAPGFSEHHTGRAVDIATPGARPLTIDFDKTSAFTWLCAHGARFGFDMPYTRHNGSGFDYEPWHWSRLGHGHERRRQIRARTPV